MVDPQTVVVVADAGLGAINAVLLSVAPFDGRAVVVALNRFDEGDDLHRRNREWLAGKGGLDVVTDPEQLADRLD
jgi:dethiobiotin synthetase